MPQAEFPTLPLVFFHTEGCERAEQYCSVGDTLYVLCCCRAPMMWNTAIGQLVEASVPSSGIVDHVAAQWIRQEAPESLVGRSAFVALAESGMPRRPRSFLIPDAPGFSFITPRDNSRGEYLCETCWDAMTNELISGTQTATGLDEARCVACQRS